jgi:hypothetical protein
MRFAEKQKEEEQSPQKSVSSTSPKKSESLSSLEIPSMPVVVQPLRIFFEDPVHLREQSLNPVYRFHLFSFKFHRIVFQGTKDC